MADAVHLVELSKHTLDDVWRQTDYDAYPESRMLRLMDNIGMHARTHTHTHTHTHVQASRKNADALVSP